MSEFLLLNIMKIIKMLEMEIFDHKSAIEVSMLTGSTRLSKAPVLEV